MPLTEQRRQQLDGIVQKMISNGESDGNIQFVVNDFKSKYENEVKPSFLEKAASFSDKTTGRLANALFETTAKVGGSFAGDTYENVASLFGRPKTGVFQQQLDQFSSSPKELSKNVAGIFLEGSPAGLGEKTTAKIASAFKIPLTNLATKLYTSALKPTGKLAKLAPNLVKTGLRERIILSNSGVEKVASKIDGFENKLENFIEAAKGKGLKIKTTELKDYLEEAKKLFKDDFDIAAGKKAIKEINKIGKNLIKKYGDNIPIEIAQRIKVNTGQFLRKHYTTLSSANIEARKQGVRFLKDKIVEAVPKVGDINERLKNLYQFDQALSKVQGKVKNLNLLGLPSKIAAGSNGLKGAIVSKALELSDTPAAKSAAAIGLDSLAKGGGVLLNKARVPITTITNNILKLTQRK